MTPAAPPPQPLLDPPVRLSRRDYLMGLDCPHLLWHHHRTPGARPEHDAPTRLRFLEDRPAARAARALFPGGAVTPDRHRPVAAGDPRLPGALPSIRPSTGGSGPGASDRDGNDGQPLLPLFGPSLGTISAAALFDATVECDLAFVRVDVLEPVAGADGAPSGWAIHTVKESGGPKPGHDVELGFATHVLRQAGLPVVRCGVIHLDRDYRLGPAGLDPARLFRRVDRTAEALAQSLLVGDRLRALAAALTAGAPPPGVLGAACLEGDDGCGRLRACHPHIPATGSVRDLGGVREGVLLPWLRSGVLRPVDLPADAKLNDAQRIEIRVAFAGRPHVDAPAIGAFLGTLRWPILSFDFETITRAVPVHAGCGPTRQIPFQFSLHVQDEPGGPCRHHEFLAAGRGDPRPALLEALAGRLDGGGSVVVYYAPFERDVLGRLAADFPRHRPWLEEVVRRLVDLEVPFRSRHYYHPDQRGSSSLKYILKPLTGMSYEDLAIRDGATAAAEFLRVTYHDGHSPAETARVRGDLRAYCHRDTHGPVEIIRALAAL